MVIRKKKDRDTLTFKGGQCKKGTDGAIFRPSGAGPNNQDNQNNQKNQKCIEYLQHEIDDLHHMIDDKELVIIEKVKNN